MCAAAGDLWHDGCLSEAWKAVWLAAESFHLCRTWVCVWVLPPSAVLPSSLPSLPLGDWSLLGLKESALCQMLLLPVSHPLKASVGLRGFEGSTSPFFAESRCCFCQTSCLVLSSDLCTRVPVTAGRPCQSMVLKWTSPSFFAPFANHLVVWDGNCSLITGLFPAQLHRGVKEKPVPGSQPQNPLGYPYWTSHQHFWSG